MLEAVPTVQPAFDDFYARLSDEQKARLAAIEPSVDAAGPYTNRDHQGRLHQRQRFRSHLPF
jgi:hypothetical protein